MLQTVMTIFYALFALLLVSGVLLPIWYEGPE